MRDDVQKVHRVEAHPYDIKRFVFWERKIESHSFLLQTSELFFKVFKKEFKGERKNSMLRGREWGHPLKGTCQEKKVIHGQEKTLFSQLPLF